MCRALMTGEEVQVDFGSLIILYGVAGSEVQKRLAKRSAGAAMYIALA